MEMAKLRKALDEYTVDQNELGKILLIASTALLVVSVHAALQFQNSYDQMNEVNKQFDKTEGIVESQSFNDSLEALNSVKGSEIASKFTTAAKAFQEAKTAIEASEAAETNLENNVETYKWLVLISILGEVAGVSIIYI